MKPKSTCFFLCLTLFFTCSFTVFTSQKYQIIKSFDISSRVPKLDKVSESQVGNPTQQFDFEGNLYSRSLLNYLRGLVYLKSLVETGTINSVLEIGGGYGTLGEIFLKSDFDRYFYVNVDIPLSGDGARSC
ncbi:putative sugar O-methyltransferase [bacterium]|nr:putative sugar O-methyltransferase [bacterium]